MRSKLLSKSVIGVGLLLGLVLCCGVLCLDLSPGEVLGQLSIAAVGIVASAGGDTKAELLQRRAAADDKANAILKTAKDAGDRDLTDDEDRDFNAACDERDALDMELKTLEKRELRNARANAAKPTGTQSRGAEPRGDARDPVLFPDASKYSILRAIRMRAEGRVLDGYEGEISQEIAKRCEKPAEGFYLPLSLQMRNLSGQQPERRDFDVTAGTGGIPTIMSGTMIDALRNRMLMTKLGARMLTGMVGDFAIPKLTGNGTAYWVAESTPVTESAQTVGQVVFTPKTLGAFTDISRKLLKQASYDAEALVQDDLVKVLKIELDRVGFNGSGSGAEPQGIMQNSSCPTVALDTNGGAPTWAMLVGLESAVGAANAEIETCAYVTSAVGRGKLKATLHSGATNANFLWPINERQINGYRAEATNQIQSNLTKAGGSSLTAVVFGDFAQALYALWGAIDVLVDPFTGGAAGTVRVITLLEAALKLRNPVAFAKCVDMVRT